jgi:hypothetical protein
MTLWQAIKSVEADDRPRRGQPYLRIPSKRAMVELARLGRFEAQYVVPR